MAKKRLGTNSEKLPEAQVELLGGEVFSITLKNIGTVTGVVSRPPHADTGLILIYLRLELKAEPFTSKNIGRPQDWPLTWIGITSSKPLLSKRWIIVGRIDSYDPSHFPVMPTSTPYGRPSVGEASDEIFSIETTLDEPSLSPISNLKCTCKEASTFPSRNIILQASQLENSLTRYFRNLGFNFHDIPLEGIQVQASDIEYWNRYAAKVRSEFDHESIASFRPAGSKTDRGLKAGDWLAFPMYGGGFGAAMLVEKPPKHLRFMADAIVLSMRRRWDHWPSLKDVVRLTASDGAIMYQVSMIAVKDGRWRVMGSQPDFKPEDWPWPHPWFLNRTAENNNTLDVEIGVKENCQIQIAPEIIALDPTAGEVVRSTIGSDGFAYNTFRVLEGITLPDAYSPQIVTSHKLAAWKRINQSIREAVSSRCTSDFLQGS